MDEFHYCGTCAFHLPMDHASKRITPVMILLYSKAYLNGLSDKGRAAARVGRPDGAAAQNSSQNANAVSDSEETDMAAAATQQPKRHRGRPRKADKQTGNQAGRASKKRGRVSL
ncbi:TPA: hypothetical protein ACH3X2_010547 [Trebouxia sp. C0005]